MDKLNTLKQLRKGAFFLARIITDCKTLKGIDKEVKKVTIVTLNAGIDYNKQSSVIEKRSSGELPSEPKSLLWGEWEVFPYSIKHKGQRYLRLYIKGVPKSVYFIDGKRATKEEAQSICCKFSSGGKPECITVKEDSLVSIKQKGKELLA